LNPANPFHIKTFLSLLRITFQEWWNDNIIRFAASLAFYMVFSLAPILLIVVEAVSLIFSKERVKEEALNQIEMLIGPQGAAVAKQAMISFGLTDYSPFAAFIGVLGVLIGSTAVFAELHAALNKIWDVHPKPQRSLLKGMLIDRLRSLSIVLGVGFLLSVSLTINAVIAVMQSFFDTMIPGVPWVWRMLNSGSSFFVVFLLFAMIYKYLPDVMITWLSVGLGAAVTALLFTAGKFLIGIYLGRMAIAGAYGAAGSFAVLLVWVYYSALISLFGAELTQVYSRRFGASVRPKSYATWIGEKSIPV
jgi:membrane protein